MLNLKKIIRIGSNVVDYKMGIAGAFVMALVVFLINFYSTNNTSGSLTAALKQGIYTFIFGGILMKGCENLATKIRIKYLALLASVILPSSLTLFLTYELHQFKGTPKPIESTLPTLVIIPATAIWGYKKRKQSDIKLQL